jgi:hypothetical protein
MELPRNISFVSLHDSLLSWFANLPDRARAFPSLEIFTVWKDSYPETDQFVIWMASAPALEGTLLFLLSFSYLHIGSLDSMNSNLLQYRLYAPRYSDYSSTIELPNLYSSRQVLLMTLRALCFLLRKNSGSTINNPADIPSPIQYWAVQPLEMFIIASSGLLSTRVNPFVERDFVEAVTLVNQYVLPSLTKLCKVWPVANHYKSKLESLLANLQI